MVILRDITVCYPRINDACKKNVSDFYLIVLGYSGLSISERFDFFRNFFYMTTEFLGCEKFILLLLTFELFSS